MLHPSIQTSDLPGPTSRDITLLTVPGPSPTTSAIDFAFSPSSPSPSSSSLSLSQCSSRTDVSPESSSPQSSPQTKPTLDEILYDKDEENSIVEPAVCEDMKPGKLHPMLFNKIATEEKTRRRKSLEVEPVLENDRDEEQDPNLETLSAAVYDPVPRKSEDSTRSDTSDCSSISTVSTSIPRKNGAEKSLRGTDAREELPTHAALNMLISNSRVG